jgi:hypothetical protein
MLLNDAALLKHFAASGNPIPFSLSTIRKDRQDGRIGGIPFQKFGINCIYDTEIVSSWLKNAPVVTPTPRPSATPRPGRPTKIQSVLKARAAAQKAGV